MSPVNLAVGAVIFITASVFLVAMFNKFIAFKHREIPEVKLMRSGMEYKSPSSQSANIQWSGIKAVDYEWGPWYEDVLGVFPSCNWIFTMKDGNPIRIEDNALTSSILIPALKENLVGFLGERDTLQKLAWANEFVDGTFHCWSSEDHQESPGSDSIYF